MWKKWMAAGAIFAGLSVILGALSAHRLRDLLTGPEAAFHLDNFRTGALYQMFHAFALIVAALLMKLTGESRALKISCWLFTAGILCFSGSLYLLSTRELTGLDSLTPVLGPITPLGGLCFIAGWATLAIAVLRKPVQ